MGHERASLWNCIAQHLDVHRSVQQLLLRRAYTGIRRASHLSGAFSESERTLPSVRWDMDAQACLRACACARRSSAMLVCISLHDIPIQTFFHELGDDLNSTAFCCRSAGSSALPLLSSRPTYARLLTGEEIYCRSSDSGATISLYWAPGLSPPIWRWIQFVQELSIVGRYCSVAARPAHLPEYQRSKGALFLMYTAMARAFPFALSQLLVQLSHSFFGGSCALHASELLSLMVLEVVELVFVDLVASELACARLALVRLQVIRMKPLCSAGLANQFRLSRTQVILALVPLPVLQRFTFAAWKLRLTVAAHQTGVFPPVELEGTGIFPHVELEGTELLQALFALVVVVLDRRVSSL